MPRKPGKRKDKTEGKCVHNAVELSPGLLAIALGTMDVGVIKIHVADDFVVSRRGRLAVSRLELECSAASAIAGQLLFADQARILGGLAASHFFSAPQLSCIVDVCRWS